MDEVVPVLKYRYRTMAARSALFVDIGLGQSFEVREPLANVLRVASNQVYIIGGWNAAATPKTEWFAAPSGWDRTAYNRNPLIAIYKHLETGRRVDVYMTAQWFGSCGSLEACRAAYNRLQTMIRAAFGEHACLMGTPARTGLDLIERALPTNKEGVPHEWPVLGDAVRGMIEGNIGQGHGNAALV